MSESVLKQMSTGRQFAFGSTPRIELLLLLIGTLLDVVVALSSTSSSILLQQGRHFIGIDLGTSGCRISVLEQNKKSTSTATVDGDDLEEVYTRSILWNEDTSSYDDAMGWITAVHDLISSAADTVGSLATTLQSICISGTSASCVIMDTATGQVTRGKARMYDYNVLNSNSGGDSQETYFAGTAAWDRLKEAAPPKHTATSPTSSLPKLLAWHAQQSCTATETLAHQADFVMSHLLGPGHRIGQEENHQGYKVLSDWHNCLKLGYDVQRLEWPLWLIQHLEKEGMDPKVVLPSRVVSPGAPLGRISLQLAQDLGIAPHTQLVGGTTDSNAAFLAAAGRTATLGTAVTSLGSTLALKLLSHTYVEDATFGVYSHRYPQQLLAESTGVMGNGNGTLPASWLVGGASNVGCAIFRSLGFSNEELTALSTQIDPLTTSTLSYYPLVKSGERFPISDPQKQAILEPRPESRRDFLHGLLEGITKVEVDGYVQLNALGAPLPQRVWTCGGGARNDMWIQMRQDRLQRRLFLQGSPVGSLSVDKAQHVEASYGAALLAAASFI